MIDNLCELALKHGGFVQELVIPAELTGSTGITNPSILIEDNKVLLNLRHVQYSLYHSEGEQKFQTAWGPLSYFNPEDDITLRTVNYICELDNDNLSIKSYSKTDTSKLDVKPVWEFIGLEDARLVKWDNKLYQSGVRRDTTTTGVGRMELSEIVDNAEVSRTRIEPPVDSYCEKNWMPILDMPYHYVKWTSPTEIVKVDIKTKKSKTVHHVEQSVTFPRDIRGGSQVISYKGYYVALTHEVDLWKNYLDQKDAHYYHRFIVWDSNWNIVYYSQEFKFMTSRIEFSCGLAIQDGQIIIPFGFQDTTAFIVKFPVEFFEYIVGMSNGIEIKNINKTDLLLESFIKNPYNDVATYLLADKYYKSKHYSSAISFYLRTAEYSDIPNTIYTSLLMVAKSIDKVSRRPHATLIAYSNAIAYMPTRPEAYYNLSVHYETKKEYHNSYMQACLGLLHTNACRENAELDYPGEFALMFQKALSAWYIGKKAESTDLFNYLNTRYILPEPYKSIVESNIRFIQPVNTFKNFSWGNLEDHDIVTIEREILVEKVYDYWRPVQKDDVVLDVGASVGPFTLRALELGAKHVYCIEPSQNSVDTLKLNTSNYSDKVSTYTYAFSENLDTVNVFGGAGDFKNTTFSSFIEEVNLDYINFMKVDCEGGEYDIFTLSNLEYLKNNVGFISAEIHIRHDGFREKFRYMRDNILSNFKNYRLLSCTTRTGKAEDITEMVQTEDFIQNYPYEFMLYISNNS